MHRFRAGLLALLCFIFVAGCTTNTSPGNITTGTVALTFAVGAMNDSAGTITGTAGTHLNAVEAFRNQLGASAYLNPGTATIVTPNAGTQFVCGIFGYGQAPSALFSGTASGGYPANIILGTAPTYPTPAGAVPPYLFPAGVLYFFMSDCATFSLPPAPVTGSYTLSTTVNANGSNITYTATANMPSVTTLPPYPVATYVSAGNGGGTFTVSPPAGVTESLIIILSGGAEVASIETKSTTAVLPAGTLTVGNMYTDYVVGADYPLVENGPPANTQQKPTLTSNANGTADLTVSGTAGFTE